MPATLRHLLAGLALLCSSSLLAATAEETDVFRSLFSYEVDNRALSLLVYGTFAEKLDEAQPKQYFQTMYRIEQLNQKLYAPYIKQYGLTASAGTLPTLKLDGARLAYWLFPDTTMGMLVSAGEKYMSKLHQLLELAPTDEKPFFEYVVAMEQTLVDSAKPVVENQDYAAGTRVLEAFLAAHQ